MKTFKFLIIFAMFANALNAQTINEGFNNVFSLYSGGNWFSINNSNPNNSNIWYQDFGNFTANSGPSNSSITAGWYCTDTVGTGDASVWLFTPPVTLNNGDSISFYTISYNNAVYNDRMEVRLNTTTTDTFVGSTDVTIGNFTNLLLTINPALDNVSYPMVWTKYTIVLSGMSGAPGRIAFRYLVPNTGGSGTNGSVVGIDDFYYKSVLSSQAELEKNKMIEIFPNPASTLLQFTSVNFSAKYYSFIDFTGKVVRTGTFNEKNHSINVEDLSNGFYTIRITENNSTQTLKFVKQ